MTPAEERALEELEFALSGPHTLDAIGRRLGLSRERVRCIEGEALGKLARLLARRGVRDLSDLDPTPAHRTRVF